MQNNEVKAFRQRLIRAGFKDISIKYCYDGSGDYRVSCVSPMGTPIHRRMDILMMRATPRVVWFD